MLAGAGSACFLQSASFFLTKSKVLGEGKTGKKNCPQSQNLERVDVNTVNPAFQNKMERAARFITGRKVQQ